MFKIFLTAEWKNLLMANYEIDSSILQKYLPCYTELDSFNGRHYVSLVGFLFANTKLRGLSVPFHKHFEEVNLRFYVRYKEEGQWKRGVVFMKEIVPRRAITFIANSIYGENYTTHPMLHSWKLINDGFHIEYSWKVKGQWNYLKALAEIEPRIIQEGSEEEFITEHYWGYTSISTVCTGVYEVAHPKWRVHKVKEYSVKCDTVNLYGEEFVEALSSAPKSVFLAEGSPVRIMTGSKIVRNSF